MVLLLCWLLWFCWLIWLLSLLLNDLILWFIKLLIEFRDNIMKMIKFNIENFDLFYGEN